MMAEKIIPDCTRFRLPVESDVYTTRIACEQREKSCSCTPIIDAEKSNEALKMVALIRNHTGSGFMAFTAE
ncbi:hypothetical protein [uncultured Methanoregula sp.]|uniref:hypothetical protein n=1 Tax=uncultured Methanoregula sp. TaxID=1005933 RepID=UPI002AAA76D9|nr:hypothetical protein [uncultured Methanoregula sp.]